MITFLQTILQKHHKFIFTILLGIIIIAFVFTIGKGVPDFGNANKVWDNSKDFYGYDLSDPNVAGKLGAYANNEMRLEGQRVQEEMMPALVARQAIALYLAKEWNLRQVNEAELKAYIETRPVFKNQDGAFNPQIFKAYFQSSIAAGYTEAALNEILSVNALTSKVMNLIGGPGYVISSDIATQYKKTSGTWDISLAVLPLAAFNPEIKVDDAALETFYKANLENYRMADGVKLSFIKVAASPNLLAEFSDAELEAFYNANASKYSKFEKEKFIRKTFAEAKDAVKRDLAQSKALREAHLKADAFVTQLYDASVKFGDVKVANIIASSGFKLESLPLVRSTDASLPKSVPQNALQAGFGLDKTNFYSDPILGEDAAYIVFFEDLKPSYIPAFADVKAKVLEDYKLAEKQKLFAAHGAEVAKALKAAVKEGKSFDEAAKAAGAQIESAKAFSLINPNRDQTNILKAYYILRQQLPEMSAGEVSDMHTLRGEGYIIYISKLEEPKVEENSAEFKEMLTNAARYYSYMASQTVVADMSQKQAE